MKLKQATVDAEKVENGDWVGDIPDMDDLRLKVRGINNKRYRSMQQTLIGAFPRQDRVKGRIPPAAMDKINGTCLAATTLLDWDNLDADDSPGAGEPDRRLIPYSQEQAKVFLTDPRYKPFYDAVVYAASIVGDEQEAVVEDDAGNSPSTPPGP